MVCVGVVKEERGLKLISLIPHILNMQDSGPGDDKKRGKHVAAKRRKGSDAYLFSFHCHIICPSETIEYTSVKLISTSLIQLKASVSLSVWERGTL